MDLAPRGVDIELLETQASRLEEVASTLTLKSNHGLNDDLEDLADEVRDIAEIIYAEVG